MSKYLPLKRHLEHVVGTEHPMTLTEIEQVLGFALPASAREHAPFWSNTHHNPAVRAFRSAGWKSSRVDLGAQSIVFVREEAPTERDEITLNLAALSPTARRFFELEAAKAGGMEEGMVRFINREVANPRKSLLERFAHKSPRLKDDSTALIREDRDGR